MQNLGSPTLFFSVVVRNFFQIFHGEATSPQEAVPERQEEDLAGLPLSWACLHQAGACLQPQGGLIYVF